MAHAARPPRLHQDDVEEDVTTTLQLDGEGFPFEGHHAGLVAVDIAVTEQRVPGPVRWGSQRVFQGVEAQGFEGSSLGHEHVGVGDCGLVPTLLNLKNY